MTTQGTARSPEDHPTPDRGDAPAGWRYESAQLENESFLFLPAQEPRFARLRSCVIGALASARRAPG